MNKISYIRSVKGTHFTGGLAQNAGEMESLDFPAEYKALKIRECIIEQITIIFEQAALEWDVYLWSKAAGAHATDVDSDNFIHYVNFPATQGKQIAGAGLFYYSWTDLNIPYRDFDPTLTETRIHTTLVNRSATAKNAGATGEVVVIFGIRRAE